MEEQAGADLERAEFLRAAAGEGPSIWPTISAFAGGVIGAIIGGCLGLICGYGLVICSPIVGIVGGSVGGIIGAKLL